LKGRAFGLGLGGNTASTPLCLIDAVDCLRCSAMVSEARVSRVYLAKPWGAVEGGDFLNCALAGRWLGSDKGLLAVAREIEAGCGSPVNKAGKARSIDVDVLFLENGTSCPELILPHPRMHLRRFVLVPLAEVFFDPVPGTDGLTPGMMLAQTPDKSNITRYEGVSLG